MKTDNPFRPNSISPFDREKNSLSRRGFLKRSGGATVAVAISWSLTTKAVRASNGSETDTSETTCPEKDYKTNQGSYTETVKDIYRRYQSQTQSDVWLKTIGGSNLSGPQPTGNFVASFTRNGCTYTKTDKAPTVSKTPSSWSSSGSPPTNFVNTLPPGATWQLVNEKKEVNRTRNVSWQATQEYQRSGSCN